MILVTNDDGIYAPGLEALANALETLDEVYIVAPDRERSAIGMAITLHRPLRANQLSERVYSTDGTPVDCVDLAVGALLPRAPALLVSGINHGQNLGHDIHFSGTVAAAKKATFLGIPSIAVSLAFEQDKATTTSVYFDTAATIACRIAKRVMASGLPEGVLLNVNVPNCPLPQIGTLSVTRQDLGTYSAKAERRLDRRGQAYFWIGGERAHVDDRPDTDVKAVRRGDVSITPVQLDFTAHNLMDSVRDWLDGDS